MELNATQSTTLAAIVDAFLAPLAPADADRIIENHVATISAHQPAGGRLPDAAPLHALAVADPTSLDVAGSMRAFLGFLPLDKQSDLRKVLDLLATGWGTWLLTSTRSSPFHELSAAEREAGLLNMALSRFSVVRSLFLAFKTTAVISMFGKKTHLDGTTNATWPALEFPGEPQNRAPPEAFVAPRFEDVRAMAAAAGDGNPVVIETDVVIVGSGAGGGVVAAELAQAGYRVLVLEKGLYYSPPNDAFNELESYHKKYDSGALLSTEDGSMLFFAGSTWGGGTAVNWSGSFRLPYEVRQEWATKHKLPYFASPAYEAALDRVCERLGVSDAYLEHNGSNQILVDGCTKLGLPIAKIAQNTNGARHDCGFCTLGCPANEKQSSAVTWLQDAQDAGAKFIQDCHVDRITYSSDKVATGVEATVHGSIQLVVKATTVVSSCGSVHSPALLQRSGLKNKNIGRHLRIHPVVVLTGFMPSKAIHPWSGSIMTSVSAALANVNGNGYGARLEVPVSLPGIVAAMLPWRNNVDYHREMLQYPRLSTIFALVRDLDSVSRIVTDATGRPRIHVSLGPKDAFALEEGLLMSAKIMLSQGAVELNTSQHGVPPLQLHTPDDLANPIECATTQKWFGLVRAKGIAQNSVGLFNAHQMGSCRMSTSPSEGVVNPEGETWEVKGLYVADASLFPTASGVNPMITTYSLAYSVAQFLKANLANEQIAPSGPARKTFGLSWWQRAMAW